MGDGLATIQTQTTTVRATGSRAQAWTNKISLYAWVQSTSSSLIQRYNQRNLIVDAKIFIAEDATIAVGDRIVTATKGTFLIHGVVHQAGSDSLYRLDVEEVR